MVNECPVVECVSKRKLIDVTFELLNHLPAKIIRNGVKPKNVLNISRARKLLDKESKALKSWEKHSEHNILEACLYYNVGCYIKRSKVTSDEHYISEKIVKSYDEIMYSLNANIIYPFYKIHYQGLIRLIREPIDEFSKQVLGNETLEHFAHGGEKIILLPTRSLSYQRSFVQFAFGATPFYRNNSRDQRITITHQDLYFIKSEIEELAVKIKEKRERKWQKTFPISMCK